MKTKMSKQPSMLSNMLSQIRITLSKEHEELQKWKQYLQVIDKKHKCKTAIVPFLEKSLGNGLDAAAAFVMMIETMVHMSVMSMLQFKDAVSLDMNKDCSFKDAAGILIAKMKRDDAKMIILSAAFGKIAEITEEDGLEKLESYVEGNFGKSWLLRHALNAKVIEDLDVNTFIHKLGLNKEITWENVKGKSWDNIYYQWYDFKHPNSNSTNSSNSSKSSSSKRSKSPIISNPKLAYLMDLKDNMAQWSKPRRSSRSSSPSQNQSEGGMRATTVYNNMTYVVHQGSRGGRYIILKGEKKYI